MPETGAGVLGRARSVRVRITLAAAVVTAVAVALSGWLMIRAVESKRLGEIHADAAGRADEVANRLKAGVPPTKAVIGDSACGDGVVLFVLDEAGTPIASNPNLSNGGQEVKIICSKNGEVRQQGQFNDQAGSPGSDEPLPVPGSGESMTTKAGGRASGAVGVASNDETVKRQVEAPGWGRVTVLATAPIDEVGRSIAAVRGALWVLLPALVGMVAIVAWWLAGRALRPVEAIRVEAEEIGGSTIHRRLPEPDSQDEIARLARTMNDMLDRLEQSAVRQRQFVADASHELKSPVAAIRTDLEVALHEGDGADWQTVARAVLAEESRLESLLADLLVLAAEDESAGRAAHTTTVDLGQLAAEEVTRKRRVPVELEIADPDATPVVAGNAARLERVLSNLVDNAARHADSRARVTVAAEGDRVRVLVDDDGGGIAPIDRERIFERFTRLDGSRARDRGGAGLGLAVVRSIATRHGGFVWADDSPLGGARFTLDLPAAAAGPMSGSGGYPTTSTSAVPQG